MQPAAILSILVQAQGLTQTQGALRALDTSARKAEGSFAGITKAATRAASVVAKVGAGGVAAGLIYSVKKAADFEAQLSSLGSVADATSKDMEALRKSALKAGAETKYSALEAAKAQTELAKGGLKTKQILGGGLNAALALAAAGEMDLADAASTTVNAMKLFGIQGGKSMKVADALATAANSTTADVSDFALALNQAGSAAKTVGLSFPETITALEALAEVGIKGSDAGTSLKTALVQLASPTSDKAVELTKKLGINVFDAHGNIKSLVAVSKELQGGLGGLTKEQRISAATTLVGQDGFRALLALYDAGPKKIEKLEKQLNKEGTAAEVAKKKQDNLKGSMEKLGGSVETLGINVGTLLLPFVRKGADELGKFADKLGVIASDKNLSVGEKLTKAFELAKVTAKPWVDKIKKAIDNANLPERLGDALTAAAPVIAEQAAKLGAGAVGVFVKAFNETNAWGKLLIGGIALKKTGAGGGIISLVKKMLDGTGGPLGKVGTMAKPVPVFVVNQGGGGSGIPGRAAGAGIIAETVAAMGGSGGIAAAAAAAVPLTAILALALTHNQDNKTKGPGASSASNPAGHVPFDQGAPSRRVGFNAPDRGMKDENTSAATIGAGRGRLKDEGNAAALVGAESLRKRLQEVAGDIRKLKDSGTADLTKLAGAATANFAEIRDRIGDDTAEGKRLAARNFGALATAISSRVTSGKNSVKDALGTIRSTLDKESGGGKDALKRNFDSMIPAIRSSMSEAERETGKGLALIRGLMVDQLKLYGFSEKQALNVAKTGDPDANKGREGGASSAIKKQRGGPIFGGAPSGDSVPAVLERGEYVLNRNAVGKLGRRQLDAINFGSARRFQKGGSVTGDTDFTPALMSALQGMSAAAGTPIFVQSGRRTVAEQLAQGPSTPGHPVAGPNGPHVRGIAADITPGYPAFAKYASKFGLGFTVMPQEPWHIQLLDAMAGAAAAAVNVPKMAKAMVTGPDSPLKSTVQGALDMAQGAAQQVVQKAAQAASFVSGPESASFAGIGAGAASGDGADLMRSISKVRGWSFADWWALDAKETGHGANLSNPTSTARLRGQFLDMNYGKYGPGSDPAQNPSMSQQIQAMAAYIAERYGNPSKALAFHNANNFYREGGIVGMQAGGPAKGIAPGLPAGIDLGKMLGAIKTGRTAKLKGAATQKLVDTIGALGFGKQASALTALEDNANLYADYANRAGALTDPSKIQAALETEAAKRGGDFPDSAQQGIVNSLLGRAGGLTQLDWLGKQLSSLFDWRNVITDTNPLVEKLLTDTQTLLGDAQKRLDKMVADIAATERKIAKLTSERDRKAKHEETLKGNIKTEMEKPAKKRDGKKIAEWGADLATTHGEHVALNAQLSVLRKQNQARVVVKDGLQDQIIPALQDKQSTLADSKSQLLGNLVDVQGLGGPLTRLATLPPIGELGGRIFDVQSLVKDMTDNPPRITAAPEITENQQQRADMLAELLGEANKRTAVSEAQFNVFKQFPGLPFAGSFDVGGPIPGPTGKPYAAVVHGGEYVLRPGESRGSSNVRVVLEDNRTLVYVDDKIERIVDMKLRQQTRTGSRGLPGQAGVLR